MHPFLSSLSPHPASLDLNNDDFITAVARKLYLSSRLLPSWLLPPRPSNTHIDSAAPCTPPPRRLDLAPTTTPLPLPPSPAQVAF
eukprot:scaffold296824_cov29-Tisochrysis_lutea.AAC.1